MPEQADFSVLRRMAAARTDAVGLTAMTPAKALRNALAKAGDDVLNTAVGVRELAQSTLLPEDLDADLPDPALFLRLDGPDGAVGIAIACQQVVGAVIEAQTIGKILAAPAADRRPTRTDAMLVGGFLDQALRGLATLVQGCAVPPPVGGYHFGTALMDARAAQMMMADAPHLCFRMDLDFGSGAKVGKLVLAFPAERAVGIAGAPKSVAWQSTLENAVKGTSARMEAVLCKLKLPLRDIAALAVGDVLTLTGASLDGVTMIGTDGRKVLTARLGRSGPVRAVRLLIDGKAPPRSPRMSESSPLATMAPMPEMTPGPMSLDAPDMAAAGMETAPMDPAPMEPAPMDPGAMDLAPMEPAAMEPAAMDPMAMDLDASPLDVPAMAEPLPAL